MTTDDDRFRPVRDQPWYIFDDNRLTEDNATEDVSDGSIRRLPHLLQVKFLDACLIRRDRRAFDADTMLLYRVSAIDSHLVISLIAILDTEVVILKIQIKIRKNQLLFDEGPDDASHLVAIELDDGSSDFNLVHLEILHIVLLGTNCLCSHQERIALTLF